MLQVRVILSPQALFQEMGSEGVILDLTSSTYFGLNEVGARLWKLLQLDSDLRRAFEKLLNEYAVDPEVLERDILEVLSQLSGAKLVEIEKNQEPH